MLGLEQPKTQTLCNIFKIFSIFLILSSCNINPSEGKSNDAATNDELGKSSISNKDAWYVNSRTIQGNAQGTTFILKTSDDSLFVSPAEVSEFFRSFDLELSTYKKNSLISKLNDNRIKNIDLKKTKYFNTAYTLSNQVARHTDGGFDPTVFPLVKAWGFFNDLDDSPSQHKIDSILHFVGFIDSSAFKLSDGSNLTKIDERSKLDFNAIAQGQSVDELATILQERGQQNYFIEVGGEIKAKGVNDRNTDWVIGIDQPSEENDGVNSKRKIENLIEINNNALATSGSYRKYYVKNGQKYSHTINPKTGHPVQHNLLSVTVINESAALADAYATAFMTMGVDASLKFVREHEDLNIDVYLLFENESGRIERAFSEGMNAYFQNP